MKLKQPFALALDFALQPENSTASTGLAPWAPVAIKQTRSAHPETNYAANRPHFTLPAVPRPLTPKDREYFRALRQAEIRAWLAADESTPESLNELIS